MNSLKTMVTAVIMAGVLYGVYIFLNRTPNDPNSSKTGDLASEAPDINMTPPTNEVSPDDLPKAFGLMSTPAGSNPTPLDTQTGVPAPASPPIANQYDPNNSSTSGTAPSNNLDITIPTGDFSTTTNPNGTAGLNNTDSNNLWQNSMAQVNLELAENRLSDAHRDLSRLYFDPSTTPERKKEIEPRLDQLAGTVVYSKQHLLGKPYKVQANDTLDGIANTFNIPSGLLVKINGLDPNAPLRPGQTLKVIQGPFNATIDLSDYELTLTTVDGRYAGRFQIGIGPFAKNITERVVYMVGGKTDITPRFNLGQTNLGKRWIELKNEFGLHGTNNPASIGTSQGTGAISLGDRDIEDLYDIFSYGSKVTIQP